MTWRALLCTHASGWTLLIRLLVGAVVFFPEGLQKLIFPDVLGAGRFAKIGIPWPDVMGPFVGVIEVVCGALIIVGGGRWSIDALITGQTPEHAGFGDVRRA